MRDVPRITATNSAGRSFSAAYTNVAGYGYGYTITTPNGDTIRRAAPSAPQSTFVYDADGVPFYDRVNTSLYDFMERSAA